MKKIIKIICIILLLSIIIGISLKLTIFKKVTTQINISENLEFLYDSNISLYDTINIIDGQILTQNYELDTSTLGTKDIEISYKDSNKIFTRKYNYQYTVIDNESPIMNISKNIYIPVGGNEDDVLSKISFAGDNEARKLKYVVDGNVDYNTIGNYDVKVSAIDNANNETTKDVCIHIYKPEESKSDGGKKSVDPGVDINYFINNYKSDNTSIGLDLSSYQNVDDFNLLKEQGIDFVILRLGWGPNEDYTFNTDKNFEDFYTRAKEAGLKVGIYYFSYATQLDEVDKEVDYVLDSIKDKDIDLWISYDWENWKLFRFCNMNFNDLNKMAQRFMDKLQEKGYQVANYGSKSYLETIWKLDGYNTWLAQYNDVATYSKNFKMWQISDRGKVNGINSLVDVDILIKDVDK